MSISILNFPPESQTAFSSWNLVLHNVTWKLSAGAGAEGEERKVSVGPGPSLWAVAAFMGTKAVGKARQEVARSPAEGGQLLEAAWGCELGALRQSFPTGEPNYDPLNPKGHRARSGETVAPGFLSQCALPILSFSM